MKNLLLPILFTFFSQTIFAQEFSLPIYFEDALGNQDSVIVGYDDLGFFEVNPDFGEVDIKGTPYDSVFEVRVAHWDLNNFHYNYTFTDPTFHHSKIQIVPKICDAHQGPFPPPAILIKGVNYPITITWDRFLFNEFCNNQTVITDWHPGGWFDSSHPISFIRKMWDTEIIIMEENFAHTTYYDQTFEDSIKMIFVGFIPDPSVDVKIISTNKELDFSIFPSPADAAIFVKNNANTSSNSTIQILNLNGRIFYEKNKLLSKNEILEIPTARFPSGIYFVKIKDTQFVNVKKVVINH